MRAFAALNCFRVGEPGIAGFKSCSFQATVANGENAPGKSIVFYLFSVGGPPRHSGVATALGRKLGERPFYSLERRP